MFRRANDRQNTNHDQNREPGPAIREEQKAENGGLGNEALAGRTGNNGASGPAEKEGKNNKGPDIRIDQDFVEDLKELKEDVDQVADKQDEHIPGAEKQHGPGKVREKVLEKIQSWVIRVMKGSLDNDDILLMNVLFSNVGGELSDKIRSMTEEIMEEDKLPAGRKAGI